MLTYEYAEEVFIRVVDLSVTELFPLVSCRSNLCSSSYKRFSEDSLCCAVSHELLLVFNFFLIFILGILTWKFTGIYKTCIRNYDKNIGFFWVYLRCLKIRQSSGQGLLRTKTWIVLNSIFWNWFSEIDLDLFMWFWIWLSLKLILAIGMDYLIDYFEEYICAIVMRFPWWNLVKRYAIKCMYRVEMFAQNTLHMVNRHVC
jgi:hypothetical protein